MRPPTDVEIRDGRARGNRVCTLDRYDAGVGPAGPQAGRWRLYGHGGLYIILQFLVKLLFGFF